MSDCVCGHAESSHAKITKQCGIVGCNCKMFRLNDIVEHPPHYAEGRKFEPIDVIEDWKLDFNLGNVVKYIARCDRKGTPIPDLKKAIFYLEREIAMREKSKSINQQKLPRA